MLESLSNDNDDGGENIVRKKFNLRPFKLYRVYLIRSIFKMQAIYPGVEFLRT